MRQAKKLPVPRAAAAAHQSRGHCLCLRCFYPIKQQTCVIGTQRRVTHSLGSSSFPERTRAGGGGSRVGGWWGGGQSDDCNVNALCWNENEPLILCGPSSSSASAQSERASEWVSEESPFEEKISNRRKWEENSYRGGDEGGRGINSSLWPGSKVVHRWWVLGRRGLCGAGFRKWSWSSTLHLGARCRALWCGRPRCIRCPPACQGVLGANYSGWFLFLFSLPFTSSPYFLLVRSLQG